MSLYLKYRPQDFKSVVGQEHPKKTLQSALASGNLAHAYLFCGSRGTGKTSMARILAKSLNCLNLTNNEPCNACEICQAITAGRLVDVIEIDAASNRGIDEIRELREKIVFAPTQAKTKVYIIDEVHMLTKEAFNALLKTLEEPPAHSYFILATTEAHKIPETIISRTQQFSFNRITVGDITQRLKAIADTEQVQAEEPALELIAKLSNGGLRDAIGLLEQMMAGGLVTLKAVQDHLGLTGVDHLESFYRALQDKKPSQAIEQLQLVKSSGTDMRQFTKDLIAYLREQMLISLKNPQDAAWCMQLIEVFLQAKAQIELSPIPELPLEMAIVKVCDFQLDETVVVEEVMTPEVKEAITPEKVKTVAPIENSTPEANETQVTTFAVLSLSEVQKEWPRVLENVQTPFVKMCLKDAQLTSCEASELTLEFTSNTFLEKIDSLAHRKEIEAILEKVYHQPLKLKFELRQLEVAINTVKKQDSVEEMASEVFGLE